LRALLNSCIVEKGTIGVTAFRSKLIGKPRQSRRSAARRLPLVALSVIGVRIPDAADQSRARQAIRQPAHGRNGPVNLTPNLTAGGMAAYSRAVECAARRC